MLGVTIRAGEHDFHGYVGSDSAGVISERIKRLVQSQRRMTIIRFYVAEDRRFEVLNGLTLDERAPGGGIDMSRQANPVGHGIHVHLSRLRGFGVFAYEKDGAEHDVARRFRSENPRNAVEIHISGWGEGQDDSIEITDYNQHGVAEKILISFDRVSLEDRNKAQAEVIETLAAYAATTGTALTATDLTDIARQTRTGDRRRLDALMDREA